MRKLARILSDNFCPFYTNGFLISYLSGRVMRQDGSSYFYKSVNGVERPSRLNENVPSLLRSSRN